MLFSNIFTQKYGPPIAYGCSIAACVLSEGDSTIILGNVQVCVIEGGDLEGGRPNEKTAGMAKN